MGHPSIYPTGTTRYNPQRAYGGYTVFQAGDLGAMLIDMNGREIRLWKGLQGFPNKLFPGGYILGSKGRRSSKYGMQDQMDLVQLDWDGNEIWRFDRLEYISDPGEKPRWMARQHHDFQRQGSPTGYYAPGLEPSPLSGNTLILCHRNLVNTDISDKVLLDDVFVEVDWEGNILWKWCAADHFEELGFRQDARNVLFRDPNLRSAGGGMGDWLHINSMSEVGPNRWYDDGDERFHPDNIIWDSREANIIAITSRKTGAIVWKIGPEYDAEETRHLGWIIGQHHAHIIPRGLPGEGNLLVFDNGGWAGYGSPGPNSLYGIKTALRDHSRILEINPVTLELVWKYTAEEDGFGFPYDASRFYSPYISSAQRLPNGNTLIDQGSDGRLFEVTAEHEIVWEYISPYPKSGTKRNYMVYRAYRVPYDWVPQQVRPEETEIAPADIETFRLPGAALKGGAAVIPVEGIVGPGLEEEDAFCVASKEETTAAPQLFSAEESGLRILKTETVRQLIDDKEKAAVLVFGAERCAKCRITIQLLRDVWPGDGQTDLNYLDVDCYPELASEHQVMAIPTIVIYKGGWEVKRTVGIPGKDTLKELKELLDESGEPNQ